MADRLKRCVVCHKEKPRSDFPRKRSAHDGLRPSCTTCTARIAETVEALK